MAGGLISDTQINAIREFPLTADHTQRKQAKSTTHSGAICDKNILRAIEVSSRAYSQLEPDWYRHHGNQYGVYSTVSDGGRDNPRR